MLPPAKIPPSWTKYFNGCSVSGRVEEAETQKGEASMKKSIKQCHSDLYTSQNIHVCYVSRIY
jgi:hypothetical protein